MSINPSRDRTEQPIRGDALYCRKHESWEPAEHACHRAVDPDEVEWTQPGWAPWEDDE